MQHVCLIYENKLAISVSTQGNESFDKTLALKTPKSKQYGSLNSDFYVGNTRMLKPKKTPLINIPLPLSYSCGFYFIWFRPIRIFITSIICFYCLCMFYITMLLPLLLSVQFCKYSIYSFEVLSGYRRLRINCSRVFLLSKQALYVRSN